jgi:N-ethylmaleimide reductase
MSPMGKLIDIHDDNPEATFGYVAERLSEYSLAYLHMVNPALGHDKASAASSRER